MEKPVRRLWSRKSGQSGFTLVEMIVVLVILGMLAAVMIPPMVGWIDKAREKQALIECRTYYLAVQTLASERYAEGSDEVDSREALELAFGEGTKCQAATEIIVKDGSVVRIDGFTASNKKTYSYLASQAGDAAGENDRYVAGWIETPD